VNCDFFSTKKYSIVFFFYRLIKKKNGKGIGRKRKQGDKEDINWAYINYLFFDRF